MGSSASSDEIYLRIPDLISHCAFKAVYHKNGGAIAAASEEWFKDSCRTFTEDMRGHLHLLKAGQLVAYCYNEADDHRLRVICDLMNVFWLLDDLSEDLKTSETEVLADLVMNAFAFPQFYRPTCTAGKEQPAEEPDAIRLTRDYWTRVITDARPKVQSRYIHNYELFLLAIKQEIKDHTSGEIPSVETFIKHRRISSGCKPLFDIIEYSVDMELPDCVIKNPNLEAMKDHVNDFVSWSNDIYSYNVEQHRGVINNIIPVIMKNYNLDLQGAIDHTGDMCIGAIDKYCECKSRLPSYGQKIDKQVAAYTRGLENWIIGSMEWSFLSMRYFGDKGPEVRNHRLVKLLVPKQGYAGNA